MNNLLKPNTTWLVVKKVDYNSSSFTNDYSVPKFTKECEYGNHKVHGFPYFRYFDVDANGIRCASKSWKISEVKT